MLTTHWIAFGFRVGDGSVIAATTEGFRLRVISSTLYKNMASQNVTLFAWDTSTSEAKTGDASNITVTVSKDGGVPAPSFNCASELSLVNAPGVYILELTQNETNADLVVVYPTSSTSGVGIDPVVVNTETVLDVDGLTEQEALRIMLGVLAGRASGVGTTTETYRDASNTYTRLVVGLDSSKNRTSISQGTL